MLNIRILRKFQTPCIGQKICEFLGQPLTQGLYRSADFDVPHTVVGLLAPLGALQALPGQRAFHEPDEDIGDGFQVVSPAQLHALVVVDRGIPGGAPSSRCGALRVVHQRNGVSIACGHAEVDEIDGVRLLSPSDNKVTLQMNK